MAKLPATGVIDADGHVLEPADALGRLPRGAATATGRSASAIDDAGLEYLEIDGAPFDAALARRASRCSARWATRPRGPGPIVATWTSMPFGAGDPAERVAAGSTRSTSTRSCCTRRSASSGSAASTTPSSRTPTRAPTTAGSPTSAATRGGRLVPIAHLSLCRPGARGARARARRRRRLPGAFVVPFTWTRVPHGHPDHDALWATAAELDVPIGIHPSYEPEFANTLTRFRNMSSTPGVGDAGAQFMSNLVVRQGVQQAFCRSSPTGRSSASPSFTRRRARVGRGLDRLVPRPHGRARSATRCCATCTSCADRRATTSAASASSRAIPTRPPRR